MEDAILYNRLQSAFTITFHYLFPQLTMGLALLIVIMKSIALWKKDGQCNLVARLFGFQRFYCRHLSPDIAQYQFYKSAPYHLQHGQHGVWLDDRS